jgi:hypothetical protein
MIWHDPLMRGWRLAAWVVYIQVKYSLVRYPGPVVTQYDGD